MTERAGRRRAERLAGVVASLAPLGLVVVAEAAWISVIAGLVQEFALQLPVLGIPALAVFVVAGVLLARLLGPRLGDRWPAPALAVVLVAGIAGWLSSPAARAALGAGLGTALAANPGGWLAAVAVLRGYAHAGGSINEDRVTTLLALAVPGLAVAAALGGLIGEPYRSRFLGDSFGAAVLFIGAAVIALALARIDAIGADSAFDWRRNPPWLALVVVMLLGAVLLAIPLASIAGTVITVAVSAALGPLLVIGLASGFDRTARRVIGFFLGAALVIVAVIRLFGSRPATTTAAAPAASDQAPPPAEQIMTIGIGGLLLIGAIAGIALLIALWMRRMPTPDGGIGERRTIDSTGDGSAPRLRWRRFARRPAPVTAVEAYVALVGDLEHHVHVRRDPAETPTAHAARLRVAGGPDLALDLLAADYALACYGGAQLPAREDRRAVGRWRALRRRLPQRTASAAARAGDPAPSAEREVPEDLEARRSL